MKLLRTIRLDPSDRFVFERAAEPGEWAVPGGFMFWDGDPARLAGKPRVAFRSGFLGLASFGWSTLAVVVRASDDERDAAIAALASHLERAHGAPSPAAACEAAREEIAFAASLCDHPEQTLIAMHRSVEDGAVRERFRTVKPGVRFAAQESYHPFTFVAVEGEDDAPPERIELARLAGREDKP
jgi:hypothetical protein